MLEIENLHAARNKLSNAVWNSLCNYQNKAFPCRAGDRGPALPIRVKPLPDVRNCVVASKFIFKMFVGIYFHGMLCPQNCNSNNIKTLNKVNKRN